MNNTRQKANHIPEKARKVMDRLSLMLYLFHWPIGKIIAKNYTSSWSWLLYFGSTFILALVLSLLHIGDLKKIKQD